VKNANSVELGGPCRAELGGGELRSYPPAAGAATDTGPRVTRFNGKGPQKYFLFAVQPKLVAERKDRLTVAG